MKWHSLSGQDWMRAIAVGFGASILTAAFMVATIKAGISPLPKSLGLAFAPKRLQGVHCRFPLGCCSTHFGSPRFLFFMSSFFAMV